MHVDRRSTLKYLAGGLAGLAGGILSAAIPLNALASRWAAAGPLLLGQPAPAPNPAASGASATGQPLNGPLRVEDYASPIRVACVGDSITEGMGTSNIGRFSYPAQLKRMLDEHWDVRNFGISGTTLLNSGDFPYQRQGALPMALAFEPNVVVIMLGANDSKPQNWIHKDQFTADYLGLTGKFSALATRPRIFVCLPVPAFGEGNYGINEQAIEEEMQMIRALAETQHFDVIDMHSPFAGHAAFAPDRVHPNDDGAALMARTVYKALTGREYDGPATEGTASAAQSLRRYLTMALRVIS